MKLITEWKYAVGKNLLNLWFSRWTLQNRARFAWAPRCVYCCDINHKLKPGCFHVFWVTRVHLAVRRKTRQPTLQCDVARKARTPQQLIDLRVGSRPTNIDRLSPAGLTRPRLKSLARRRRRYHRQDGGGARQSPAVRLSLSLSLISCLSFLDIPWMLDGERRRWIFSVSVLDAYVTVELFSFFLAAWGWETVWILD